ncbi:MULTISPECIES: AAA family ATPase [unclassified Bradyrhizobium]
MQCFKNGPDYIDPAFHAAAAVRASVNLDSWAMDRATVEQLVGRGADADLVLAEGSMGLFDGVAVRGVSGTGATADIAEMMGWPVLLVIDPSGQAQTAAAVAAGLRDFRAGVRVAGVVLNRVASPRHEELVRQAFADSGARDGAFSFVYPHILERWRSAGAEIATFSPLADEGPDESADVCWLPGGYPELHAGRLAANARFRSALRAFAETRAVHGECGGYMVLGAALTDSEGARHEMVGLLGLETSFAQRRMHLGYRLAELAAPIPGHRPGARLRGHEFHYSTILAQPDPPLAVVRDASGANVEETGSRRRHATGTFFHLIAEER